MGLLKRGKFVRVLKGVQDHYTDQILVDETDDTLFILERTYDERTGFREENKRINLN